MGAKQCEFFEILSELRIEVEKATYPWLLNVIDLDVPGQSALQKIFIDLSGDANGMRSKGRRRLTPDGYLPSKNCLIEFDELQHFTKYRAKSLCGYPAETKLGFSAEAYLEHCHTYHEKAVKKGPSGYNRCTKDFPFQGGRQAQRALFDTCRDLLPSQYGLGPTIRIAEFDVPSVGSTNRAKATDEVALIMDRLT